MTSQNTTLDGWVTSTKTIRPKKQTRALQSETQAQWASDDVGKTRLDELPAELLDLICHQSNQRSLKNLSLTCGRLRQPAQARLFQAMKIQIRSSHCMDIDNAFDFYDMLCDILRRVSTVRRIKLRVSAVGKLWTLASAFLEKGLGRFFSSPKVALEELVFSLESSLWLKKLEALLLEFSVKPKRFTISKWPTNFSPLRLTKLLQAWPDVALRISAHYVSGPEEADVSCLMHFRGDGSRQFHALELLGDGCEVPWYEWMQPSLLASLSAITFKACDSWEICRLLENARKARCDIPIKTLSMTECSACEIWEFDWGIPRIMESCPRLRSAKLYLYSWALVQDDFSFEDLPASLRSLTIDIEESGYGIDDFLQKLAKAACADGILPNMKRIKIHTNWQAQQEKWEDAAYEDYVHVSNENYEAAFEEAKAVRSLDKYPGDPRLLGMSNDDYVLWMDEDEIEEAAIQKEMVCWIRRCNAAAQKAATGFDARRIRHNLTLPFEYGPI